MHIDDRRSSDGRTDDRAGPAADDGAAGAAAWEAFEARLAAVLARMAVDSHLVLSTRGELDEAYHVHFAQGGRPGFRARAVGNRSLPASRALSPAQEERLGALGWQWPSDHCGDHRDFSRQWPMRAPFREVARLAVRTLREVYGVDRPADLVYRRFDDAGRAFVEPALGIEVDGGPWPRPGREVGPAPDEAELAERLEEALRGYLRADEIVHDDDGDVRIRSGSAVVFVRLLPGPPPIVRVFSPVLRGVAPSPELLAAVNDVNVRVVFARALCAADGVFLATELPAAAVDADRIGHACAEVGNLADAIDGELRARFGGETAFEDAPRLLN
ncbi:MAG: YbjN domain-containing protein [Chloroflexi bacterium]|jgi:hypothetical protein|nr:YbjN domain-containing protein [Chloroflexota bacterium]